jgi:hypothetical protein
LQLVVGVIPLAVVGIVVATWQALFDFAMAERNPTAAIWSHFVTGSISCQFALLLWLIARWHQPWTWLTPIVLFAGATAFHAAGRRFR